MAKKQGTSRSYKKSKVSDVAKLWGKAKEIKEDLGSFIDEPMTGLFQLQSAEITKIGQNDWMNLAMTFKCVEEGHQYEGDIYIHRAGLENDDSIAFLQRDLETMGVDLDDVEVNTLEDIEGVAQELADSKPVVRAKLVANRNNDFLNMRIQKLVEREEEPEEDEPEEDEPEEEEEVEPSEGDTIHFEDDKGTDRSGSFVKWKGDKLVVLDFKSKKRVTISPDQVTSLESEEEEPEEEEPEEEEPEEEEVDLEKGTHVIHEPDEKEGVVQSVDEEKGTAMVLFRGQKKAKKTKIEDLSALAF